MGHHELSHFYKTCEGWIFLDSNHSELNKLEGVESLQGISSAANTGEFLRAVFQTAPANY